MLGVCPGPASASTASAASGAWRCGPRGGGPSWSSPTSTSSHGDAAASAHLLTFDSVHGRWRHDAAGAGERLVIDGTDVGYSRSGEPDGVPWGELGVEVVLECSGRFRTREALDGFFRAGRAQGDRRRARQAGGAERRRRRQRPPLRPRAPRRPDGGVVHDELPRARRQGDPRGHRHPPRRDHDAARHDQHADAGRRAAQGPAPGARRHALADPDDDRLGDRDRADLPGARRASRRARRPRPAAQRVAHRLRVRGRPARRPSRRSTTCSRPQRTVRSPASSASSGDRSSRSTTRTTRARRSWTRSRRWSPTGRRSRSSPGTTTSGATPTAWPSSRGRSRRSSSEAARDGDGRGRGRGTCGRPLGRPAQLRARHGRLLGGHDRRRSGARARPLLLLRARLQPVRGRLAVPLLRALRHRHEPRRRLARGPPRAQGDAADGARHAARRARDARGRRPAPGSSCPT